MAPLTGKVAVQTYAAIGRGVFEAVFVVHALRNARMARFSGRSGNMGVRTAPYAACAAGGSGDSIGLLLRPALHADGSYSA